jgi:hypothetical protein
MLEAHPILRDTFKSRKKMWFETLSNAKEVKLRIDARAFIERLWITGDDAESTKESCRSLCESMLQHLPILVRYYNDMYSEETDPECAPRRGFRFMQFFALLETSMVKGDCVQSVCFDLTNVDVQLETALDDFFKIFAVISRRQHVGDQNIRVPSLVWSHDLIVEYAEDFPTILGVVG